MADYGCGKHISRVDTGEFRDLDNASHIAALLLSEIAYHHELVAVYTSNVHRHNGEWNRQAFEIVGESRSSESAESEQ